MKGDTLTGKVTIASLRRSQSHPEKAVMVLDFDMRNQRNQQIMTMSLANLVAVRHPEKAIEGESS